MDQNWLQILTGATAIFGWLIAGVFLAFSDFVMKSLGALSATLLTFATFQFGLCQCPRQNHAANAKRRRQISINHPLAHINAWVFFLCSALCGMVFPPFSRV